MDTFAIYAVQDGEACEYYRFADNLTDAQAHAIAVNKFHPDAAVYIREWTPYQIYPTFHDMTGNLKKSRFLAGELPIRAF